jgi:Flp pilus assembly protein TadG
VVKKGDKVVTMKRDYDRQGERGTSVAEFAMVALLFFTLIFGIIEFGRMLYTHNSLADATRRGARYAVLHPSADAAKVKNVVVYGDKATYDDDGNPTSPPVVAGLTPSMVDVTYEGEDLDGDPDTAPTSFGSNLGQATVKIVGYSFSFTVPVIGRAIPMGDYLTTLSAESAGEIPADITVPSPTPVSTPEPTPESTPEPTPEPTPVSTPEPTPVP